MDIDDEKKAKGGEEAKDGKKEREGAGGDKETAAAESKRKIEKEKVGYELENMSRVLPGQLKHISFPGPRYKPVKKVGSLLRLFFLFFANKYCALAHRWTPSTPRQPAQGAQGADRREAEENYYREGSVRHNGSSSSGGGGGILEGPLGGRLARHALCS